MFEEKRTSTSHSYAIRLFSGLPWAVRGFLILFNIILFALLVFGLIDVSHPTPTFGNITSTLTELLKLVGGAVIGALAQGKKESDGNNTTIEKDQRPQIGKHNTPDS